MGQNCYPLSPFPGAASGSFRNLEDMAGEGGGHEFNEKIAGKSAREVDERKRNLIPMCALHGSLHSASSGCRESGSFCDDSVELKTR